MYIFDCKTSVETTTSSGRLADESASNFVNPQCAPLARVGMEPVVDVQAHDAGAKMTEMSGGGGIALGAVGRAVK